MFKQLGFILSLGMIVSVHAMELSDSVMKDSNVSGEELKLEG